MVAEVKEEVSNEKKVEVVVGIELIHVLIGFTLINEFDIFIILVTNYLSTGEAADRNNHIDCRAGKIY